MVYKIRVLDIYQQAKLGVYQKTYRVRAGTAEEAREIMIESIIHQALERDELDVLDTGDMIIVYGRENDIISDVFFIVSVEMAENQFE